MELTVGENQLSKALPLCEICKNNSFKYKCSKCLLKYCSIPCLNKHKEQDKCSNRLYDPLEYVSNKDIKSLDDEKKTNNLVVKRDYEYLIGMDRIISVARSDFSMKNKYLNSYNNTYNNRTINKFLTENGMELKFIMQRGCRCFLLPEGSSVHKRNKSRYDNKLKKFQWTMNWNVQTDADDGIFEPHEFTLDRCFEDFKLIDIISKKWSKDEFKKNFGLFNKEEDVILTLQFKQELVLDYITKNKIQFFLKHYPNKMNNLLDTNKAVIIENLETITVSELLTGKTCLEFPTIFVKIVNNNVIDENDIKSNGKEEIFHKQNLMVYKSVEDADPPKKEEVEKIVTEDTQKEVNNLDAVNTELKGDDKEKETIAVSTIAAKIVEVVKEDNRETKQVENKFAVKRPLQDEEKEVKSVNTIVEKKQKSLNTSQNINNHLPKSIPDLYENTDSDIDSDDEVVEDSGVKSTSNSLAAKLFG